MVEYKYRPDTWQDYFARSQQLRSRIISMLNELSLTVNSVRKEAEVNFSPSESWKEGAQLLRNSYLLPKPAVDEWGFVEEHRSKKFTNARSNRYSAISTLDSFRKSLTDYVTKVANFTSQSIEAFLLVANLKKATNQVARKALISRGEEFGITENLVRLSLINGMDACIAARNLHRAEHVLQHQGTIALDQHFNSMELDAFQSTFLTWALFCFTEQIVCDVSRKTRKIKNRSSSRITLRDCLSKTVRRIEQALKELQVEGIRARIINESIRWNETTALWIAYDTNHPVNSLVAIEKLWSELAKAFRPDREKIVRMKAIDWYWEKIILVPLVEGRSIERQAYDKMNVVAYSSNENLEGRLWAILPENIPEKAWADLGLECWQRQTSWGFADEFTSSYVALFHHVDHMADFSRCKVEIDEIGEKILQNYLNVESKRAEPYVQKTFDTYSLFADQILKLEADFENHPNLVDCIRLMIEMKSSIFPSEDFHLSIKMTIDMIADWRDRLKAGLSHLGYIRALWLADSLKLAGYTAIQI